MIHFKSSCKVSIPSLVHDYDIMDCFITEKKWEMLTSLNVFLQPMKDKIFGSDQSKQFLSSFGPYSLN